MIFFPAPLFPQLPSYNVTSLPMQSESTCLHIISLFLSICMLNKLTSLHVQSSACPSYHLSSTFTWPCNVTLLLTHYTSMLNGAFQWLCIAIVLSAPPMFLHTKRGRPSAGGSLMSGVWGREKPRQAFPPAKSAERLLRTRDLVTQ